MLNRPPISTRSYPLFPFTPLFRSRSPGHPKFQRHVETAFWVEITNGLLPIEAAAVVGVAQAVGQRWFRNAGGMPPFDLKFEPTGRYLSDRKSTRLNSSH